MLSLLLSPKVITLSGFYCTLKSSLPPKRGSPVLEVEKGRTRFPFRCRNSETRLSLSVCVVILKTSSSSSSSSTDLSERILQRERIGESATDPSGSLSCDDDIVLESIQRRLSKFVTYFFCGSQIYYKLYAI
jgi:hypothetical protein